MVKLGELTKHVRSWNPSKVPEAEFKYLDLSSVDHGRKQVSAFATSTGGSAPSRARQLVAAGDVLVSTVRPNLNAVAMVPKDLDGATASTGFAVLRPVAGLDGRYLFHWVQTPEFVSDMVRKATGASYPAVSDRIVKESLIPAPDLREQRRIAAILDQAEAVRAKHRQVLAHLDDLIQSIFLEMFGHPETWSIRWEMGVIGDLVESVQYGTSAKAGDSGQWPILRMGNVTDDGRLNLTDLKYIDLSPSDVPKYTARRGDLLFNRTNSKEKVGKSCVVDTDQPLAIAGYLIRVRLQPEHRSEFVCSYLTSRHGLAVRRRMAKAAVNQANINATELRSIPIAIPPTELQRRFASRVENISQLQHDVKRVAGADNELFASLQSRAFRGELR